VSRRGLARATVADLEAERQATREGDLRWCLEDSRGRRLLRELLYNPELGLGLDTIPLTPNGSLMFAEMGKRAAAKKIDDRIRKDFHDLWLEMHREAHEAKEEHTNLRETAESTETGE